MEQQDKAIRVVVAEDEPYLRRDIANAIRARQGMRLVGEAATEAESVQAALEGQADVVLMDVEMDRGAIPASAPPCASPGSARRPSSCS